LYDQQLDLKETMALLPCAKYAKSYVFDPQWGATIGKKRQLHPTQLLE
jgi:hypothetical protein